MVLFPEVWNADIPDNDKFGFGRVELDILVEKISGNIDLATGNTGMKLKRVSQAYRGRRGIYFLERGERTRTRKGLYSTHSCLQSIATRRGFIHPTTLPLYRNFLTLG